MSEPCQVARDIHSKQLEGRNALHDCIPDNYYSIIILYIGRGGRGVFGRSLGTSVKTESKSGTTYKHYNTALFVQIVFRFEIFTRK